MPDALNTHKLGSLYEAFEPYEARRIAQRLEFHYTPTHGSYQQVRGCLNRRISDEAELRRESSNASQRSKIIDARRKLQHIPTRSD